jgi:hypothetical protein
LTALLSISTSPGSAKTLKYESGRYFRNDLTECVNVGTCRGAVIMPIEIPSILSYPRYQVGYQPSRTIRAVAANIVSGSQ